MPQNVECLSLRLGVVASGALLISRFCEHKLNAFNQLVGARKMSGRTMRGLFPQRCFAGKAHRTIVRITLALVFFMVGVLRSPAEDEHPVLQIEAGMHTVAIYRISSDAAGRLALTASLDKTARLWDLSTGRLIRVLRVPIGYGAVGQLYCGALSPDGTLAAVGGVTGSEAGSHSIYLFDPATGNMVRRIGALPNTVFDIAFSADGRYLAAVFGSGGLRVWESASGQEIGRDEGYNGQSYGVDWAGSERLVTTCYDGKLRLYSLKDGFAGAKLNLVKKSDVKGGKRPSSARFSPDGSKIAVGFDDSTAAAVVDGKDLSFRFAPDTSG